MSAPERGEPAAFTGFPKNTGQRARISPLPIILIVLVAAGSLYLNSIAARVVAGQQIAEDTVQFSANRYLDRVRFLASDDMRGRGDGSPELEEAADYIASQFRASSLVPAGNDKTYFQTFEIIVGADIDDAAGNQLILDGTEQLKLDQDFVPIRFSKSEKTQSPAVFAGYGITAPNLNWDDYQGIDVTGRIVIVLRHEPQELDPDSIFDGKAFTIHASFVNKAINAKQHGARGIIFITDPNNHPNDPDEVGPATKDSDTGDLGIAAVHARQAPVLALFDKAGKNLSAIQRDMDKNLKPQSFELPGSEILLSTNVVRHRKPVRNVMASIPGSDPVLKNEWVVIGAHYDHLGLGDSNSLAPSEIGQIHHGADDNASGTAGVLELARLAAQNKASFKRSLLFMTFAGEEIGLLGSEHFVNHPTIPVDKIAGMINMDMIGRVKDNRLFMGGVGTSPNFKMWLEEAAPASGLTLDYTDSGNSSSDHTSFLGKHIPVLFFFSGLHSDYHRPSDTADKINASGAVQVLSLAYTMARRVANASERPAYTEVREQRPGGGGGAGYGPYFGSVPDFRDDLKGVLYSDVRADSPAAKAGLKGGDLMTSFDGKPTENLYDFTYALQGKKPGDVVQVVVQRNGQTIKVDVTLGVRK